MFPPVNGSIDFEKGMRREGGGGRGVAIRRTYADAPPGLPTGLSYGAYDTCDSKSRRRIFPSGCCFAAVVPDSFYLRYGCVCCCAPLGGGVTGGRSGGWWRGPEWILSRRFFFLVPSSIPSRVTWGKNHAVRVTHHRL